MFISGNLDDIFYADKMEPQCPNLLHFYSVSTCFLIINTKMLYVKQKLFM